MLRMHRSVTSLGISLALGLALLVPAGVLAGSPEDLLPDLRMARPSEIRLNADGAGRRLLRFSALIINAGQGPFVVRGKRDCATSACPKMTTVQRIKQTDGSWRGVPSAAAGKFDVGDGHNHWHVMRVQRYELFQLDPPPEVPSVALRGAKTGFCFFDTTPHRLDLPRAPQQRVFYESGCGRSDSTSLRMGLSVGWADYYGWFLPRQWIDTTGVDDGRYLLCSTANAQGHWLEKNGSNNQSWAEIRLLDNGADADTVTVLRTGRSACADQLTDGPTAMGETGTIGTTDTDTPATAGSITGA